MGGSPSGGGSTTTIDEKYNAGMLELSKEQQGWAGEMFNMFKFGVPYDPNEQAGGGASGETERVQTGTKRRRVDNPAYEGAGGDEERKIWKEEPTYEDRPVESGLYEWAGAPNSFNNGSQTEGEKRGYDPDAQVSEMEYLQNLVEANQGLLEGRSGAESAELALQTEQANAAAGLIPSQTGAARTGYERTEAENVAATGLLPYQTEAARSGAEYNTSLNRARGGLLPGQSALAKKSMGAQSSFIDEASKGVDEGKWMDQAQAGVQHGFKNANKAMRKDISSYGLDPSAGRYTSQNRDIRMKEASGVAGARTGAQRSAEAEGFRRKQAAAVGVNIPTI